MLSLLAADIGGTHSRFALFRYDDAADDPLRLIAERTLRSRNFAGLGEAVRSLYREDPDGGAPPLLGPAPGGQDSGKQPVQAAVLAVAGAVNRDFCRLPNAPWDVHAGELREVLGLEAVFLLNDFAAQAYACLMPWRMDMAQVLPGAGKERDEGQSAALESYAVVGAGTGFGTAHLLRPRGGGAMVGGAQGEKGPEARERVLSFLSKTLVLPAEGGHAEFPFMGKEEFAFAEYAARRAGASRLINDFVVGGSGFAAIASYLTGKELTPEQATATAAGHEESLALYARFYGRACRNFVLSTLALDGLYISGGMAMRVPVLTHSAFAAEFLAGSQAPLLAGVPVYHMQKPQAGLWGAALYGLLQVAGNR